MSDPARSARLGKVLALLAVVVLAFLAGVATERLRWDTERSATLQRLDGARRAYQERLIEAERAAARASSR